MPLLSSRFHLARILTVVFVLALVPWPSVLAQTPGATNLTGVVLDERKHTIVGARVAVRNMSTGVGRDLVTDSTGEFRALQIPPGIYEVTAEAKDFATTTSTNIAVDVGVTKTIQITLKVSGVFERVSVIGETPMLEPEATESSQVIDQTLVSNLPINGRRWENFVLLTPAVTTDGGFGLVSYRGISGLYNNNTVDGADNNQAFFSESRGRTRIAYSYSQQTIEEFQVTNSDYTAEFGRSMGGIVNAVTKSGTNAYHGDLFWYLRQFHGDALDPLAKSQGNFNKPEKLRNQFGADLGGPIIRDKLLFYAAYDGQRRTFPLNINLSNPNYFSAGSNGVANVANCMLPAPTFKYAAGGPTQAQCTAAIGYLQSLVGTFPRQGNQDIGFGKLLWKVNDNNDISGSLNWHRWDGPNAYSNFTPSNNGNDVVRDRFVVVNWTSTLNPNYINNLRFQYGQDFEADTANSGGPAVAISNAPTYGLNNGLPRTAYPDERRWQVTEAVSITHGKHTFKAGTDINAVHEILANLFQGNGNYSYAGNAISAFQSWVADVFNLPTTDLLGNVNTGKHYSLSFAQAVDPITGVGADDFWNRNVGLYFQDTWHLRSNLTVNYGLRYDLQLVPQPPRPNTATPLLGLYTSTLNIDANNFGPRLGISWGVTPKTLVRAGYGLYYAQTSNSTYYALRVENGIFQQTVNCTATSACAPTFPNLIFTPPGPTPAAPFSGAVTPQVVNTNPTVGVQLARGLSPNFVNPRVHMGELSVERELPGQMTVSGTYLLSRAQHLPVFIDSNLAAATTTRTYDVTNATGTTVSTITVPFYNARVDSTGAILTGFSAVNSWYHGFVLSLKKRYSSGLELLANFTFSKSTDNGAVAGSFGTFTGTDSPIDPHNLAGEHALSDLDQRKRFVTSFVYTPPFFHTASPLLRKAFDGIGFAGVLTIADGQPVNPLMSGSPSCASGLDGGVTCGEISSFGSPTGGRVPQLGRNSFTGPGFQNFDFRIQRDIHVGERYALHLAVDAFNLANTTIITGVTSTAFDLVRNASTGLCQSVASGGTHTNDCIAPHVGAAFMAPTATGNQVFLGARQLQLALKFTW